MTLDTDVLIEISRGRSEAIPFLKSLDSPTLRISGIVAMEFLIGSRDKHQQAQSQKILSKCEIIALSPRDSLLAVTLVEEFGLRSGLSLPDYLIAAQALNNFEVLYSFNIKHFSIIPGLDVWAPYERADR